VQCLVAVLPALEKMRHVPGVTQAELNTRLLQRLLLTWAYFFHWILLINVCYFCTSVLHICAQVRQLAEAKEAELNARLLQLESHIHWLSQDNQRLQEELQQAQQSAEEGAAAAQAAAAAADGQQQKAAAADLAVSVFAAPQLSSSSAPA
jgi:uncharacterized protein YlxW (UPF0749 family)